VFDSVDTRVFVKVLSMYGIQHKYMKVVSAMCENNTAAVQVRNEVSS